MSASRHIGNRISIGISGAGKTHSIKRDVFAAVRDGLPVVVLDRMREWGEAPADVHAVTRGVLTIEEVDQAVTNGARLVIVRASGDPIVNAIKIAEWAKRRGEGPQGVPTGLAFPEAHRVAPRSWIDPALEDLASAWRHFKLALWWDTQRIAKLHASITENPSLIRIFATVGDLDLARLAELGGRELAEAALEAAERLGELNTPTSQPGWHVRFLRRQRGGYELVRE